jgi:hypothetical protein
MKLNYTIEVNQALEDAFLEHLRNIAAGMGYEDQRDVEELIAHVERTNPEDWNDHAKYELTAFLMLRAGFQFNNGGEASEWEDTI